ncbi:hypothetical protein K1X76_11580 [bacterium]|nr:hypothetical protein [bacterium]
MNSYTKSIFTILLSTLVIFIHLSCKANNTNTKYSAQQGIQDAEENIKNNKLYLVTFGEELPKPKIDPETKLEIITLGCEGDPEEDEYIKAYNDKIKTYLKNQNNKKTK